MLKWQGNNVIISRDKGVTGTILIWTGANIDDLFLDDAGFWDTDDNSDTDLSLIVSPKDFKKLFVNEREWPVQLPRKGTKKYIPPFILRD